MGEPNGTYDGGLDGMGDTDGCTDGERETEGNVVGERTKGANDGACVIVGCCVGYMHCALLSIAGTAPEIFSIDESRSRNTIPFMEELLIITAPTIASVLLPSLLSRLTHCGSKSMPAALRSSTSACCAGTTPSCQFEGWFHDPQVASSATAFPVQALPPQRWPSRSTDGHDSGVGPVEGN